MIAGAADLPLSPLRAALLGLLATEPDYGVSTARAIHLLWRSAPSGRLKHRISQLVYSLNRRFPERLIVRKGHRHFLSDAVATDYGVLLAAIASNRLTEAAELLRRGFLSELTRPPSEAFSEWLEDTRIDLRARIRQAAATRWTRLTGHGRWRRAAEPAQALLSLDAYDEQALRMLIRAEAMSGRVREAEATFHSFMERSAMGKRDWTPETETLSLLGHIREMPARTGRKIGARPADTPPLIGRSEELAAISAAMLSRPGQGMRVVVIRGERGVGKTRLVEESLATGMLDGIRILRTRASELERGFFLNSILEALRSADIDADVRNLAEPWRGIVLELLPEVGSAPETSSGMTAMEAGRVHRRYLEAISQLLVAIARERPTILFIDDAHRVDADSAAVLRHVAERWPSLPLSVTLAASTGNPRDEDPVARLLGGSLLQCQPTEFSLGTLTREAAVELVDTLAGDNLGAKERDRIVQLSDRNPFFMLELANQSRKGQRLPQLDPDDFVPVPQTIARVFAGRLRALDDDAERVLQLLAVLGRPLCVGDLSRLADRSRDSTVQALDRLQHARLVGLNGRWFAVRHELIRHVVCERMNTARIVWAYGRVARFLEDGKSPATPADLAVHYHHARMRTSALRHAVAGARAAEESGSFAEASKLYALARHNTDDPRIQARMSARRARLDHRRRDVEDGPRRLAAAAFQLRNVHRPQSALIADIQRLDLLVSGGSCAPQEAAARIRKLGRTAERKKHWRAVAKAIDTELHIHRREGRGIEADNVADRAGKLLNRAESRYRGCLHASLALHHQGDLDAGLEHAREAIAIARQARAPNELLRALGRLVAIQGARGLITDPETVSAVEEGEALARDGHDFVEHYNLLAGTAAGYRAIGLLDQAHEWFSRAGTTLTHVNTCEAHVSLQCKLGELALEAKKLDQSAVHFDRARKYWTPGMGRYLGIIGHSGAGLIALRLGDLSLARQMAEHISRPPVTWFDDPWVFALFKAQLCEWRGVTAEGVDSISKIARLIETSLPAHWARLKFTEALLRLRHSLPGRDEVADTAAKAAGDLGNERWIGILEAARKRGRAR